MEIPRKPKRVDETVEGFIKKGSARKALDITSGKKGRHVISLSLMEADSEWIAQILEKINDLTERKITRSEIVWTALAVLKEKSVSEILEIIKNR